MSHVNLPQRSFSPPTMTTSRASLLRARIADAEDDITSLEAQLAQRQADKTALEAELAAIAYPILTLPPEITTEIMLQAVAVSANELPAVVASVCTRWRRIALSTPRLWTRFSQTTSDCCFVDPAAALERWIQRSGHLPLDIELEIPQDESRNDILELLTRNISRLRCVELFDLYSVADGALEWARAATLPFLALHDNIPLALDNVAPESVPAWSSVRIRLTTRPLDAKLLQSFRHAKNLALEFVSKEVLSSVLRFTPAIETLTILSNVILPPFPVAAISFPHVHTLHYVGRMHLPYITLPGLAHLTLDGYISPAMRELNQFLQRSHCTLRSLSVRNLLWDDFLPVLRTFNSVAEFSADIGSIDEEDASDSDEEDDDPQRFDRFHAVFNQFRVGDILPDVVSLTLTSIPAAQDAYLDVLGAVLDRARSDESKLQTVRLEVPRGKPLPPGFTAELLDLGVQLSITRHDQDH
uniref:F-box domain-containing protein n=1 Tax=Mycena chlorophos TaxID=658473 RepID=A0ABQ0LUV4_MYCCL|nr:predicted protein [Mycena chlorophos]